MKWARWNKETSLIKWGDKLWWNEEISLTDWGGQPGEVCKLWWIRRPACWNVQKNFDEMRRRAWWNTSKRPACRLVEYADKLWWNETSLLEKGYQPDQVWRQTLREWGDKLDRLRRPALWNKEMDPLGEEWDQALIKMTSWTEAGNQLGGTWRWIWKQSQGQQTRATSIHWLFTKSNHFAGWQVISPPRAEQKTHSDPKRTTMTKLTNSAGQSLCIGFHHMLPNTSKLTFLVLKMTCIMYK